MVLHLHSNYVGVTRHIWSSIAAGGNVPVIVILEQTHRLDEATVTFTGNNYFCEDAFTAAAQLWMGIGCAPMTPNMLQPHMATGY